VHFSKLAEMLEFSKDVNLGEQRKDSDEHLGEQREDFFESASIGADESMDIGDDDDCSLKSFHSSLASSGTQESNVSATASKFFIFL